MPLVQMGTSAPVKVLFIMIACKLHALCETTTKAKNIGLFFSTTSNFQPLAVDYNTGFNPPISLCDMCRITRLVCTI